MYHLSEEADVSFCLQVTFSPAGREQVSDCFRDVAGYQLEEERQNFIQSKDVTRDQKVTPGVLMLPERGQPLLEQTCRTALGSSSPYRW